MVFLPDLDTPTLFSYKLTVTGQRFNAGFSKELDESVNDVYPFLRVGVATLGQQTKKDREGTPS